MSQEGAIGTGIWAGQCPGVQCPLTAPSTTMLVAALMALLPTALTALTLSPSVYPPMGNRRWEGVEAAASPYHQCHDQTAEWHEWETGSTGTIKVKRNGSATWSLRMVFTHPVALEVGRCTNKQTDVTQVYNGVADAATGTHFEVAPPPWGLARLAPGQQERVSFKVNFPSSGPR